jgi:hypothetical protein
MLALLLTEVEVYNAIMQMQRNKSPEPDGFSAEFYQACWGFIKFDLVDMFASFHYGELLLYHLNFGSIVFLPKKKNKMMSRSSSTVPFVCLMRVSRYSLK